MLTSNRFILLLLALLSILSMGSVFAQTDHQGDVSSLTLSQVLTSIKTHHPNVKAELLKLQQADAKRRIADGAFDWQYQHDGAVRSSGYYDGWYSDHSFIKPLPFLNAKVSAGYRMSDGDFPVYEEQHRTMTGGEVNLGVSFSLLRDRDIDEKRYKQMQAGLDRQIATQKQQLTLNKILKRGAEAYLNWYQAVRQLAVIEELVALAEARRSAIENRVAEGDLATMDQDEFMTTLYARQEAYLKARQQLDAAAQYLSLFWRNDDGTPQVATEAHRPTQAISLLASDNSAAVNALVTSISLEQWLEEHPEIKKIDKELQKVKRDKQLAQNNLLPGVDLSLKVANDFGAGSSSLNGTESRIGLSINVPLERTKAKAKRDLASFKKRELLQKKQLLVEQLTQEFNTLSLTIDNLAQQTEISEKRAVMAKKLVWQEQQRFDAGDSDLFRLNARETSAGQAQMAAVNTRISWLAKQISQLAVTASLTRL